jgi:energy-coupling factor transport system substrate-specific component
MEALKRWVAGQFTTRVIVLMPVAIAINIVLGATVQQALKLPIYLDSIGTILVGVLAGPLAGALTGILTNLIWGYLLPAPIGSAFAGPFAITAGVIGLLAGLWGQFGLYKPRRGNAVNMIAAGVAVILVGALAFYTYARAYASEADFNNNVFGNSTITFDQSRLFFLVVLVAYVALVGWALFLRRDVGSVFAIGTGLVTGIAAAIVSAPIAAVVYGGVMGSGTDALVAAFRAAGDSLYQATLKQGLLSDPMDKMITSFVVFFIVGSLSRRFVARFPLGEKVVREEAEAPVQPAR